MAAAARCRAWWRIRVPQTISLIFPVRLEPAIPVVVASRQQTGGWDAFVEQSRWRLAGLADFDLVAAIFGADTVLANAVYIRSAFRRSGRSCRS
jgi:hypothetical protein